MSEVTPRILVLRALGLGDLLTAVPALRGLRRHFPGHRLVLATPGRLAQAARATGLVDDLLPASAPGRGVPARLDWSGPPPDIGVDLQGNGVDSHRLVSSTGPARIMAFAHPDLPQIRGPAWNWDEHERARWCRLVAAYGVPADPDDTWLPAPPPMAYRALLVHPGADAPARRWPADRFAAVARAGADAGMPVVISAGAGERHLAQHVAAMAGLPDTCVRTGAGEDGGDLPFDVLAALVASAAAVVCGDTGVAHLASAFGTPSVVLFGPVPPARWGPPDRPQHKALWHPGALGDPHGDTVDPLLSSIQVPEVFDALRSLLSLPRLP